MEQSSLWMRYLEDSGRAGTLAHPDFEVAAQNPVCGDILRLSCRLQDGIITDAKFKATGCAAVLAVGSALAGLVLGQRPADLAAFATASRIEETLGGLPQNKRHAAALAAQVAVLAGRLPSGAP